jgi:uncharacterized protein (TIGR02301 family)
MTGRRGETNGWRAVVRGLVLLAVALVVLAQPGKLAAQDSKPYDDRLLRLSEILGAVHYLRELCGHTDGQLWRDKMRELMDSEGSSALRRAKLTRGFNQGYRAYSRTYTQCSTPARGALAKFLGEGVQLAEGLVKSVP